MRIRTKLLILLAGTVSLSTGIASWLSIDLTKSALEQEARKRASEVADHVASSLSTVDPDYDEHDIGYELEFHLRRNPSLVQIEFLDPGGTKRQEAKYSLWYDQWEAQVTRKGKKPAHAAPPPPPRPIDVSIPPLRVVKAQDTRGIRVYEITKPMQETGSGRGQLVLRFSLAEIDRHIETLKNISALVTLFCLILAAGIAALVGDRVVGRRLKIITEAMQDIEGGDLTRRVPEDGGDEVEELSRGFNRMITRVAEADTWIRAFNERLAEQVREATRDLAEKHDVVTQLNNLLVEARRQLGDKERLAALGQLAAQLAHEVGTPLSSVSGHLQLALARPDVPQPLRDRLAIASRELERVSKIIRDYLDSTRPMAPEIVPVQTEQLLREAVEIARRSSGRDVTRIDIAVESDARSINTDPGLLRQIAINLITNAVDAVESRGGHVTVTAKRKGEDVLIDVKDNGAGIAGPELARVFEPFYTTKGRGKGTGLGLAICRELAVSLGGKISVESQPGQGSDFTVRLPARAASDGSIGAAA